jgi:hypothetical protein
MLPPIYIKWPLSFKFSNQNFVWISHLFYGYYMTHQLILLDLIT